MRVLDSETYKVSMYHKYYINQGYFCLSVQIHVLAVQGDLPFPFPIRSNPDPVTNLKKHAVTITSFLDTLKIYTDNAQQR